MFSLLGVVFIALGLILLLSSRRNEQAMLKRAESTNKHNHKKQKNKVKQEYEMKEIKKSKSNAYSFIFAGICCILVEIVTKFL